MDGEVFQGRVLNQPHRLQSVRQWSEIKFVPAAGAEFPVMVTAKYLKERGFSELFDAPSDLIRVVLPSMSSAAQMNMFTAFCPLCGGV